MTRPFDAVNSSQRLPRDQGRGLARRHFVGFDGLRLADENGLHHGQRAVVLLRRGRRDLPRRREKEANQCPSPNTFQRGGPFCGTGRPGSGIRIGMGAGAGGKCGASAARGG